MPDPTPDPTPDLTATLERVNELAEWMDDGDETFILRMSERMRAAADLRALCAEVRALRADAARLDWLEATPRPADAVTEAMRDLLASAIGQAVVSCAHFASRNIPTEAWNVDYAGIIARALAVSPAQRATPGADGAA